MAPPFIPSTSLDHNEDKVVFPKSTFSPAMRAFFENKRVLITGATSGLGREMARQLAAATGCNVHLALTGRRADRLRAVARECQELGAKGVIELAGGVDDAATVEKHAKQLITHWSRVEKTTQHIVAILNAGIGESEPRSEFDAASIEQTMNTNYLGAVRWIEQLLPTMRGRGVGTIAGISSPASWRGYPTIGPYSASKAALSTILESLRIELRVRAPGVRVITICPGFVKSEMTDRNRLEHMPFLLETEDGAARILKGIASGRRVVHFPWQLTWPLWLASRYLPAPIFDALASRQVKYRNKPWEEKSDDRDDGNHAPK